MIGFRVLGLGFRAIVLIVIVGSMMKGDIQHPDVVKPGS